MELGKERNTVTNGTTHDTGGNVQRDCSITMTWEVEVYTQGVNFLFCPGLEKSFQSRS